MVTRHLKQSIKQVSTGDIQTVLETRKEELEELQKKLNDEVFRGEQRQIKASISQGYDLNEVRYSIGIESDKRWRLHVLSLSLAVYTPENLMLNYRHRSRARYSQIIDLMNRARNAKTPDRKIEAQCILMLCKLDASEARLAQALGLVKLTQIEGEDGVTGNDPSEYEHKIRELERSINRNIDELRLAMPPISIDVQYTTETGRENDIMGETSVSENATE